MKVELLAIGSIFVIIILLSVFVPIENGDAMLRNFGKSPELTNTGRWINSEPLKIGELQGSVVLIDFWTYSCINCIRTLPYLKSWHEKYADKGLVIIGVHTPEFEFEKDYDNVKQAVEKFEIKYPVVQDNEYGTWRAFKNNYWPRKYLIDVEGNIRYDHIGEGAYDETEEAIVALLKEKSDVEMNETRPEPQDTDFGQIRTPELYFGHEFARVPLGNKEGFQPNKVVEYSDAEVEKLDTIYLKGAWRNNPDNMEAVENASISLIYDAKSVNIVASGSGNMQVVLDGSPDSSGGDVEGGVVIVDSDRLYNLISLDYSEHKLTILVEKGIKLHAFTFG